MNTSAHNSTHNSTCVPSGAYHANNEGNKYAHYDMKPCLIASCIYINTTRNTGEMRIVSNHSARVIGYPVFVHTRSPICDLRVCIVQVSFLI